MQIELPIFRQILGDAQLHPRELQVWRAAIEYLDVVELRRMKVSVIEHHLAIDRSTAWRALNSLVAQGYLCRVEAEKGDVPLFRVPMSRRTCDDEVAPIVETEVSTLQEVPANRRPRSRVLSRGVL